MAYVVNCKKRSRPFKAPAQRCSQPIEKQHLPFHITLRSPFRGYIQELTTKHYSVPLSSTTSLRTTKCEEPRYNVLQRSTECAAKANLKYFYLDSTYSKVIHMKRPLQCATLKMQQNTMRRFFTLQCLTLMILFSAMWFETSPLAPQAARVLDTCM